MGEDTCDELAFDVALVVPAAATCRDPASTIAQCDSDRAIARDVFDSAFIVLSRGAQAVAPGPRQARSTHGASNPRSVRSAIPGNRGPQSTRGKRQHHDAGKRQKGEARTRCPGTRRCRCSRVEHVAQRIHGLAREMPEHSVAQRSALR